MRGTTRPALQHGGTAAACPPVLHGLRCAACPPASSGHPPWRLCLRACAGVKLEADEPVVQHSLVLRARLLAVLHRRSYGCCCWGDGVACPALAAGSRGLSGGLHEKGAVPQRWQLGDEGNLCRAGECKPSGGRYQQSRHKNPAPWPARHASMQQRGSPQRVQLRGQTRQRMPRTPGRATQAPTGIAKGGGAGGVDRGQQVLQRQGGRGGGHQLRRHLLALGACRGEAAGAWETGSRPAGQHQASGQSRQQGKSEKQAVVSRKP